MENYGVMLETALISIIIPTYNRAHIIGETLDSIIAQTYTNWECIVVDDGSTDNTAEIMSDYMLRDKRFRYYKRPENKLKGPCSCRNYGFEKSKGDFINFFDSDDIFMPCALEEWVGRFTDCEDVVVSKVDVVDLETNKKKHTNNFKTHDLFSDFISGKMTFFVSGPLWSRSFLLKQEYLFDESIRNVDDWDFNLRMLYTKPKIAYLNSANILYRWHENSFSKEMNKLNEVEIRSDLKARVKHIELLEKNELKKYIVILELLIVQRFKHYLRRALVENNNIKYFVLRTLLKFQWRQSDILGVLKTLIGFVSYTIFNKGYVLLKD
ncbi:glycosyltransferase family 2 protein [Winogradskyella rapida]|uniref:Glycosyltransferase family 2 protein n=1 Tax=Winogradskyella rapida TaxID=549701 RepID=A0ABW3KLF0_9FLAO